MITTEEVILVNTNDEAIGVMEKMEAHEKGLLHRAFSVFIFNSQGLMLLQQRAPDKYHSPELWTNACCGHPRPGENTLEAAKRRLKEEMGIETNLQFNSVMTYKAIFNNNLTEHEVDHIFTGIYNQNPSINPNEAMSFCWKSPNEVKEQIKNTPEMFTYWFKKALETSFSSTF